MRATCTRVSRNTTYRLAAAVGSQVVNGASADAKSGYSVSTATFMTRPGGGAWTLSDIQALEARIESLATDPVRCTCLYADVIYTTPLNTTNIAYAILEPPVHGLLLDFDPLAGTVAYRPETNYAGPDLFRFTVWVDSVLSTGLVSLVVQPLNDPPQFVTTPPEIQAQPLTPLSVTNRALDVDLPPQVLSYLLIEAPASAGVDAEGVIRWTPGIGDAGSTNRIMTRVTDGLASATNSFNVRVIQGGAVEQPVIQSVTVEAGVATVSWTTQPGASYRLQFTDDLATPVWMDQLPDVSGTGGTVSATNAVGVGPSGFYRVLRMP
jgi:hypothetical protein